MKKDKIVQFVCFETTLNLNLFTAQWDQYNTSANSQTDLTLQQSEKNGVFKYITQHRFENDEIQFAFTKPKKSSRVVEIGIKEKQAGGYSLIQSERKRDAESGESKVFVFFTDAPYGYDDYNKLTGKGKLNIYEAYYQNSKFAAILEYFVKTTAVASLVEQIKLNTSAEIGVYNECVL